ncbi:hypothetical protein BDP27DRAFT_1454737 [Rhodocollybia butyracea]|uniref:Uncharacterized protein n=1 Tax=Rhodocollybia butyracea TaxID=206335 RepID=A0A9P5P8J9_9AGAR|nr:hypothetical protein BDP27DRAFT_1454737 [Rhodocollybia butyracea]
MVYSRSVLTAILAAGAFLSVLAVPVPGPSDATAPPASSEAASSAPPDPPSTPPSPPSIPGEHHHGNHHLLHHHKSQPNPTQQGAPAAGDTSNNAGKRRSIHEENRHHHHAFHQLKEAVERVDHAKERLSAAEDHLHHLFHIEDEGEFVSKHRLYKAKHRLHQAEHRLHIAEKHLHQVKHEFEEGEFDRKHHHGHDHFRFGKAAAPPFIQEGLQDAAELLAALRLDQHAAAPGSKHEEAPVAFEIAIAPRGNGVPSTATSNQQAGGIANAPGQNMKRSVGPLGNNATAGMATPTRRSLHGDDLD